ncbi:transposable element Tcb2 transposase [Trichonephila clavipes]|nr:transposable element Tcb2 transposase [Trichonephila clavipes]
MQMIQVLCKYTCSYTPRLCYNQEEGAIHASTNSKIPKRDDCVQIAGRLCWSTCRVVGQVDSSECAVRNCWEQWTREGTHARKTGSGVTRKTTRREDRSIMRQALVDPTVTRSTIRAYVGVAIVPQTISRHLAEAIFKSKCLFRALPLTPEHRNIGNCVYNSTKPDQCGMSQIGNRLRLVMNPDFVLRTDVNCVRVWMRPAYDSRSTLIVMRGTLMDQRYVDDILQPHIGPFLNCLPGAIFQQDNARPHTARVAQDFLRHFQTLSWPPRSPNLSSVEHVWDQLKRQMPSCPSVNDLELAAEDMWTHLSQYNIRCLINSMPDLWRYVLQLELSSNVTANSNIEFLRVDMSLVTLF